MNTDNPPTSASDSAEAPGRYARQEALADFEQHRFTQARVAVVGAGGLGAPVLPVLAGAGVGVLHIVDGDTVEVTNLHRQTLFGEHQVGQYKAELAAVRCRELNSAITVTSQCEFVSPSIAATLAGSFDVIVDCGDNYATTFMLSDACLQAGTPLISASVIAYGGYVGGYCGTAPSLRAVFPTAPTNASLCSDVGVLGSVVSVVGSLQAHAVLMLLQGLGTSPMGVVTRYDGRTGAVTSFNFQGATEPDRRWSFIDEEEFDAFDYLISCSKYDSPQQAIDEFEASGGQYGTHAARLVFSSDTGLDAWQWADAFASHWDGEIAVIASQWW